MSKMERSRKIGPMKSNGVIVPKNVWSLFMLIGLDVPAPLELQRFFTRFIRFILNMIRNPKFDKNKEGLVISK